MTHSTDAATRHSPRSMARAGGLHGIGVYVLLAGAFLPVADFFIVNVALPTISTWAAGLAIVSAVTRCFWSGLPASSWPRWPVAWRRPSMR